MHPIPAAWLPLSPEQALNGNGSAAVAYFRRGSGTDRTKFLVFLGDGGLSVNTYTAARPLSREGLARNGFGFYYDGSEPQLSFLEAGLVAPRPENPFLNWSVLAVPYSTADFHLGTADFTYPGAEGEDQILHHHGFSNFFAFLHRAEQLLPETPSEVLVCGSSAGGFAAPCLAGEIAARWKLTQLTLCVDSALLYYDWPQVARKIWGVPENLAARIRGNNLVWDGLLSLRSNCPSAKLFFCYSVRDLALSLFQNYLSNGNFSVDRAAGDRFQNDLLLWIDELQLAYPEARVFLWDKGLAGRARCTQHGILNDGSAFLPLPEQSVANWLFAGHQGSVSDVGLDLLEKLY